VETLIEVKSPRKKASAFLFRLYCQVLWDMLKNSSLKGSLKQYIDFLKDKQIYLVTKSFEINQLY